MKRSLFHSRFPESRRLPLTIVGGFLGAGKSTWLRHQLYEGRFGRVCLLVNEAAQTPLDHLLLSRADYLEVLSGACVCCQGRDALVAALRRACQVYDASGQSAFTHMVLETSGLADPANIAAACAQDPLLARRLCIREVIVLVDALHAAVQLGAEPLARRQVQAASHICVTKPDSVPDEDLARLHASLKHINPAADIQAAEYGIASALPAPLMASPYPLSTSSLSEDPIVICRLDISAGSDWVGLSVWLSALLAARGDDIVRVKGVVATPSGRLLLQSVRKIVQPPEILPDGDGKHTLAPEDNRIVLLGRNMDEERLQYSWRQFAGASGAQHSAA